MGLKLKLKLNEAKSIEDVYSKEFNSIDRDIFDSIIALDPETDLAKNKIGQVAKAFLLPKYVAGETEFLDLADEVKEATGKFETQRSSLPQSLRNINNFPTVKDFVEYMLMGEESDFGKSFNPETVVVTKKESKIDNIYKTYYSNIDRATFDKIIALDSQTVSDTIGLVAKNLLLPKYIAGEDFLPYATDVESSINTYYKDVSTYPTDKQDIANYPSVKEFIDYVNTIPDSDFITELKNNKNITGEYIIVGSTREYDIVRPLTHKANNAITCLNEYRARYHEWHTWCTGWTDDTSQWKNHSGEYIFCFISRTAPKNRLINYQLSIYKNNLNVCQFLDGDDKAFGDFNAGSTTSTRFFEQFLIQNPDVTILLSTKEYVKDCPTVQKILSELKYAQEEITLSSFAEITEFNKGEVGRKYVKKLILQNLDRIPAGTFQECAKLMSVSFPEGLKEIGAEAFMNCTALNGIQFPKTLEKIGAEAFAGCLALRNSIAVPDLLTYIGREAFRGTHCTLSINKRRTNGLHIDKHDIEWFNSHHKAITVSEELEEDFVLDENIPADLARAYRRSEEGRARGGLQQHTNSKHFEIDPSFRNAYSGRRHTLWDYAHSNYEEISKERAWEIVRSRDPNEISKLRLIIDGQLVEFEDRGAANGMLTKVYSLTLSPEKAGHKKDGTLETDASKVMPHHLINVADKIYYTDEYEHPLSPDVWSTRLSNTDKASRDFVYQGFKPQDELGYDAHSVGGVLKSLKISPKGADTGSHNVMHWIARSDVANAYNAKKTAFKEFDYARKLLKKHIAEKDAFEEDEYNEILNDLQADYDSKYQIYLQRSNEFKTLEQRSIVQADTMIQRINSRLATATRALINAQNTTFNYNNQIAREKSLPAPIAEKNKELQNNIEQVQQQIRYLDTQKEEIQRKIEELQNELENNANEVLSHQDELERLNQQASTIADVAMQVKFTKIENLIQARNEAIRKYLQDHPNSRLASLLTDDAELRVAPELANIIHVDNDNADAKSDETAQ